VAHQNVELAGGVSFGNRDVIWLTFATEAQSICAISVLHWMPTELSRSMAARVMLDSASAVRSACVRGFSDSSAAG
jgi:hypothetical protein